MSGDEGGRGRGHEGQVGRRHGRCRGSIFGRINAPLCRQQDTCDQYGKPVFVSCLHGFRFLLLRQGSSSRRVALLGIGRGRQSARPSTIPSSAPHRTNTICYAARTAGRGGHILPDGGLFHHVQQCHTTAACVSMGRNWSTELPCVCSWWNGWSSACRTSCTSVSADRGDRAAGFRNSTGRPGPSLN